jgi:hypothetical protein
MSKKSDDSIERIFRQALTQFDTTFRSSDWLKMEKMLDEEANRRAAARSKRIKGTGFALIGLTGLIVAVYFLAFRNPSDSIVRLNNSETETQATDDLKNKGNVMHENPSAGLLSETDSSDAELNRQNEVSNKSAVQLDSNSASRQSAEGAHESDPVVSNAQQRRALKSGDGIESGDRSSTTTPTPGKTNGRLNNKSQLADAENRNTSPIAIEKSTPNKKSLKVDTVGLDDSPEHKNQLVIDNDREKNKDPQATISEKSGIAQIHTNKNTDASGPTLSANEKPGTIAGDSLARSTNAIEGTTHVSRPDTGVALQDSVANPSQRVLDSSGQPAVASAVNKDSLTVDALISGNAASDSAAQSKPDTGKKQKTKPASRLSIALVIAPEFSTTTLNEYSSPGESIGLRIGYQVSNRFNINTGIIRSNKKYIGEGYEYTPRNPAYWKNRTNGVIPEEINSKCLVYELPIGVQFDIIQNQKSRLFASTAISSYFMISQAYDYTFDAPNPGADMGWRSVGSESYWFSIGMVSAGYERYVHRSIAIGIEPYLKISMSEIGWPNVKLFSTGAYVTLRYRFMSQKKNSME